MAFSQTLSFSKPLSDVRLLTGATPLDWEDVLRQREEAALLRGRGEGEKSVNEQLVHQRAEIAELQRGILDSLRRAVPQVIQETEGVLMRLAIEVAQKIVAGLPIGPEMVEAVVREALSQVEDTAEITIQLHPDDLALLRKQDSALLNGVPGLGPLRFAISPDVSRGGCLVQTRFGLIDATRETKVDQLQQSLAGIS
jgi:flagellar assembly protein FliH